MAELLSKAKEDDSRPQRTLSAGIVAPISEEQDSNPCGKVVIYIPDNGRDPGSAEKPVIMRLSALFYFDEK